MTDGMGGIQATYDLADRNNGYGYGDGMCGGGWFWIILILLFAGRGFGWGNGEGVQGNLISGEFIKRDIFNTNQNVSATGCQTQRDILESRYTTELGFKDQLFAQQQCCCETNRNIDSVRADAYKNTCEITTAIHAEGEATRALINANTIQDLRDRLEARDRELMTANFQLSQQAQSANIINTLRPVPQPAYLTCSPYFAYNYGGCSNCGCNGFNI